MTPVDINVVHLRRPRRQGNFAPCTRCSGIVGASCIGWDTNRDAGTVIRPGETGHCSGGAGQGSHTNGEEGCELHVVNCGSKEKDIKNKDKFRKVDGP